MIQISLDQNLHNGWSMDYQGLPPVDLFIAADPDTATAALAEAIGPAASPRPGRAAAPLHQPTGRQEHARHRGRGPMRCAARSADAT